MATVQWQRGYTGGPEGVRAAGQGRHAGTVRRAGTLAMTLPRGLTVTGEPEIVALTLVGKPSLPHGNSQLNSL